MLGVQVKGVPELEARIQRLAKGLNTRDLLDQSAALLFNNIRRRFLQQIDPDGVPWVPSKAALRRASSGRGGGTLYDTGRLFHSIQVFAVGSDSRAIGTDVPYASFAQQGSPSSGPRIYLGFADRDTKVVQDLLVRKFTEAFANG